MKKHLILLISAAFVLLNVKKINAQTGIPLGLPLNTSLNFESAPSLSANGRIMLLRSDTGEDKTEEIVISYLKGGRWSRPATLPGINTKSKIFNDHHYISMDGNTILFTSNRYGGIGNNDIWSMTKNSAGNWNPPVNAGKPINSTGSEGDPGLSPDGRKLFFVKYEGKTGPQDQPCGKIYLAEMRGQNRWEEPVALPAPVNMGCECNPRMLADGKTMTFASIRNGGQGGYDQYVTRMDDKGKWSNPVPFTTVNSDKDDLYITIPASGELVYSTGTAKVGTDIVVSKIPDHLKPDRVILQTGKITDENGKILDARVVVTDLSQNSLSVYNSAHDGTYVLIVPKGSKYDVAIQANDLGYFFYSKTYLMDTLSKYAEIHESVKLKKIKSGLKISLDNIDFTKQSKEINEYSTNDLNRLANVMKDFPKFTYKIIVSQSEIITDSIKAPDLTEVSYDTIYIVKKPEEKEEVSEEVEVVEEIEVTEEINLTEEPKIANEEIEQVEYIVKTYFHNDRTRHEADLLKTYMLGKGVNKNKVEFKGIGKSNSSKDSRSKQVELIIQ